MHLSMELLWFCTEQVKSGCKHLLNNVLKSGILCVESISSLQLFVSFGKKNSLIILFLSLLQELC